ncbi:MAG: methionyl-tRNA formyltransferase [Erysipelotrichaceae bacterium]
MKSRIIFMGTPMFACEILKRLINEKYNVIAVVSQPDKKVGRKHVITPTPLKVLAQSYGIDVYQPIHIKDDIDTLCSLKPDLIITCAYGQFISQSLLDYPTYGSVNVHASLLPKLRGGAPIHKAIMYGYKETGISIMRMSKQMDAGAVMAQSIVKIEESDTMGSLSNKLAQSGCDLLIESLPKILDGSAVFIDQIEGEASVAYNISKEEEKVDFNQDVEIVYNHIRSLIPSPIAYALLNDKKIKFHKVRMERLIQTHQPGELLGMIQAGFAIAAINGTIIVDELQLEGKAKCDALSFYNGSGRTLIGSILK